jgi:hypothetical protein
LIEFGSQCVRQWVGGGSQATRDGPRIPATTRSNHERRHPRTPLRLGEFVHLAKKAPWIELGAVELSIEIKLLQVGIYASGEADDRRSEIRSIETIGGRSLDRRETRLDCSGCGEGGGRSFPHLDRFLICADHLGWRDGDGPGRLNPTCFYARKNCESGEASRQCCCDAWAEKVSNHSRRFPRTSFTVANSPHDFVCQLGGRLWGWQ